MHALMRRLGAGIPASPAPAAGDDGATFAWDIEETGPVGFEPRLVNDRAWRLWLGLGVVIAIVGLGVAGRLTGHDADPQQAALAAPTRTATAGPLISISSPREGGTVSGGVVQVRGTSDGVLVHGIELALVAGDAVLGDAVLGSIGSQGWTAELRVFTPPVGTQAVLMAAPAQANSEPSSWARTLQRSALVRLPLSIVPAGPVGLWPLRVEHAGRSTRVLVAGCAPLTLGRLGVRLVTGDDRTVTSTQATIAFDAALPGARGGYALGVGSFSAVLTTESPVRDGGFRIDVDWRDEIDGTSGTSTIAMPGINKR
jgi:hypothetical protein